MSIEAFHREAATGGWFELSLMAQLGNIGTEVARAARAKAANNERRFSNALSRALELFDLTIADDRWSGPKRREVCRARELCCDFLTGRNIYGSSVESIDRYFMPFAVAARRAGDGVSWVPARGPLIQRKPAASILAPDQSAALQQMEDLRFSPDSWTASAKIPAPLAERWMDHLLAGLEAAGQSFQSLDQLHPDENSGSIETSADPRFALAWSRARGGPMDVVARGRVGELDATAFLNSVTERQASGELARAWRRDVLAYVGLPWKGELWLDDCVRLGPPSKFPEALLGPQAVLVDVMASGIGTRGIGASFQSTLAEIQAFLAVVLGDNAVSARTRLEWVPTLDSDGKVTDVEMRPVGYVELTAQSEFPSPGEAAPCPRRSIARPGLGPLGIWPDMLEVWVPDDVEALWQVFRSLDAALRDQFMNAANALRVAMSMSSQPTVATTYLVIALEALRPFGASPKSFDIFRVIEVILGRGTAESLRRIQPSIERLRGDHVHQGRLGAGELTPSWGLRPFQDPSFDQMYDVLYTSTRSALVQWLVQRQT